MSLDPGVVYGLWIETQCGTPEQKGSARDHAACLLQWLGKGGEEPSQWFGRVYFKADFYQWCAERIKVW